MVRPLKGKQRRMLRTFSYDGELEQFLHDVHARAASESRTFSEVVVLALEEYSRKHWQELKVPEIAKALQEIDEAARVADEGELELRRAELIRARDLYKCDRAAGRKALERALAHAIPTLRRTKSPAFLTLVEKARALTRKALSGEKRKQQQAGSAAEEKLKKEATDRKEREEAYAGSAERVKKARELLRSVP